MSRGSIRWSWFRTVTRGTTLGFIERNVVDGRKKIQSLLDKIEECVDKFLIFP
jgi:hypothetical protein